MELGVSKAGLFKAAIFNIGLFCDNIKIQLPSELKYLINEKNEQNPLSILYNSRTGKIVFDFNKKKYYRVRKVQGHITTEEVMSENDLRGHIFDEDGNMVFYCNEKNNRMLSQDNYRFSDIPCQLAVAFIKDWLNTYQIHKKHLEPYSHLKEFYDRFPKEYQNKVALEDFFGRLDGIGWISLILDDISQVFKLQTGWNDYRVSVTDFSLRIDNDGDFRINDWMQKFGGDYQT